MFFLELDSVHGSNAHPGVISSLSPPVKTLTYKRSHMTNSHNNKHMCQGLFVNLAEHTVACFGGAKAQGTALARRQGIGAGGTKTEPDDKGIRCRVQCLPRGTALILKLPKCLMFITGTMSRAYRTVKTTTRRDFEHCCRLSGFQYVQIFWIDTDGCNHPQ